MRLPIATKVGKGRSTQLTAEMLVNMYAEAAPQDSVSQIVAVGCPGMSIFSDISVTELIRGIHKTLADGALYTVIGNSLFNVAIDGSNTNLGTIGSSGRVSVADNGTQLCIVAGSKGYTYSAAAGLQVITDSDFPGAESVTYMDGYFIFNNRQSGQRGQFFISDLLDGQVFDAADFATAERYPDNLVRVFADHSELLLFGTDSIEIWFNAGNADFPFSRAQGSVIEQGLGAKWTVEKVDESVIWLDNEGIVRRLEGNTPVRISTHAIEYLISLGDWTNAYTYAYTMEGHQFYVLTVPAANLDQRAGTYVWDAATGLWHQRKSYEKDIHRAGFYANVFGEHIVGDVFEGRLFHYSLSLNDERFNADASDPIIAEMQFPTVSMDGKPFIVNSLQLDMDVGPKLGAEKEFPVPSSEFHYFDTNYWTSDVQGGNNNLKFQNDRWEWDANTSTFVRTITLLPGSWSNNFRANRFEAVYNNGLTGNTSHGIVVYDTNGVMIGGEAHFFVNQNESHTFSFDLTFGDRDIAGINLGGGLVVDDQIGYPSTSNRDAFWHLDSITFYRDFDPNIAASEDNRTDVMLRESKDGGRTYGMTEPWRSMGAQGEYQTRVIWRRRGRAFKYTPKIAISANVRRIIFAAYIEVEPLNG